MGSLFSAEACNISDSLEASYIKKKFGGISVLEAFSLAKTHKKTLSNDTRELPLPALYCPWRKGLTLLC